MSKEMNLKTSVEATKTKIEGALPPQTPPAGE
jgi:hypothetical protein